MKRSGSNENINQFRRDQVTPNSLDYSASTDLNSKGFNLAALQNKNLSLSKECGNLSNQHEILQRAFPYRYDENQFATLGQSPQPQHDSRMMHQDEELESTVFGQSSINAPTFNEGTTRFSDDQAYFGNMKANPNISANSTGLKHKMNIQSNLDSISSSVESTPHKAFRANLLDKKQNQGYEILTGKPAYSYDSLGQSYESPFQQNYPQSQHFSFPNTKINNELDDEKAPFNPMNTHEHYDLSKYNRDTQEGNEILIDNSVQPIAEQSDEESRIGNTGNTTPISSEPRGGYPISSNTTTPYNYTSNKREEEKRDTSPYANFSKSNKLSSLSRPNFGDGEKSHERSGTYFDSSGNNNTFDEKTTDLTEHKSFMDKTSSLLSHTAKQSSTPDGYGNNDALIGSHLYNKHQINNLQFSQLSQGSVGPYDGTTSKIMSSPTIHERQPESEEESQNDSQLKMSQLNDSPQREEYNYNLKFEDLEQPKTGTIGETTNRLATSSSINFVSGVDSGSGYYYKPQRSVTDFDENDYKSNFKNFIDKHYERQTELNEIKPSTIFKERYHKRFQNRYNFLMKRTEESYESLQKVKLLSLYGSSKEHEIDNMMSKLKDMKENSQPN